MTQTPIPAPAHRNLLIRIGRWSVLLIGVAASLLLFFVAAYNFITVRGLGGDYYLNLGLFRGSVLSCSASAIFLVATAAFRQLPRFPKADRPALLLLIVGAAIGVAPLVYGNVAKELCLGSHRSWNVTQMMCEK